MLLYLRDESPEYADVAADIDYVSTNLASMIASPSFIGLIHEGDGGCMFGTVGCQWYSADVYAYEHILYALPEHRGTGLAIRLIRGFEAQAKDSGAAYVSVGVTTGVKEEQTNSLYVRLGYEKHRGGLRKRLH